MKFAKTFYLLLVILFLSAFVRIYHLSTTPASLNPDEAALGYTAFSLSSEGIDEHGKFLPLSLLSFGDGKLPLYPYLDSIFVKFLGLNEFSTRLPSALAGIVGVMCMYGIAKVLFKNEPIALICALFYAFSPWNIYFSHAAYEANLSTTLFLGALYLFLLVIEKKINPGYFLISALLFGLTLFTYHAYVLFVPLFILVLILISKNKLPKDRIVWGSLLMVIFFLISSYFTILKGSIYKASNVGIFNNQNIIYQRAEKLRGDSSTKNIFFEKILYNKYTGVTYQILQNYLSSFSPEFLFDKGGEKLVHTTGFFGNMYLTDAFFILAGIVYLFWNREKFLGLLSVWLILSPLASSITEDAPNTARLVMLMPVLILLSAYGVGSLFRNVMRTNFKITLGIVLSTLFVIQVTYFLDIYFTHFDTQRARFWKYGYKQAVLLAKKYPEYKIVMRGPENFPYIYFLFYENYDPHKFAKEVSYYPPTREGFLFVKSFDRFTFLNRIDYTKLQKQTIYIDDTSVDQFKNSISLPSGEPILGYLINN